MAATLLLLLPLVLLSGCAAPAIAQHAAKSPATKQAAEAEMPTTALPDKVRNTWIAAVNSYPYEFGRRGNETRDKNLAAMEELRKAPWPDLGKVSWVRLTLAARPEQPGIAWLISQSNQELVLLMPDFSVRRVERKLVSKIEPVDPAIYFDKLLASLKNRKSDDKRPWDFTFIQDFGARSLPYYGGSYLLHQAYAAAWLDLESVSTALIHEAFQQQPLAFVNTLNEGAWQSFSKGIQMLEDGEPRTAVLAHWEQTLQLYPGSRYKDQLTDLVGQLRFQVREDAQLARSQNPDLSRLTQEQLIHYHVERLGDVHGYQVSQPGHCRTLGFGAGTTNSDALVKIGRPAIPALLGLLRDQRLTRSIGYWRNFSPDRVVLRYQDVAVQCIEAILEIRFYHPSSSSSYLSTETANVQFRVIDDIQSWWDRHGQETPLQGQLARLEAGSVYDRVRTLHKIESLDPEAIDSVQTLKRWAEVYEQRGIESQTSLVYVADELARRGDFKLLPVVRQLVHGEASPPISEAVWYLLAWGDAEDYRYILERSRKEIAAGVKLGSMSVWGAAAGSVESTKKPLAVPILVEFLARREMTGSRYQAGFKQAMPFSKADTSIEALIRLTGHDTGYKPDDPAEQRLAAIDRWLVWWSEEGKAAYVADHPEVLLVDP